VTKERRLGKGLAALLGTPMENDGGYETTTQGTVNDRSHFASTGSQAIAHQPRSAAAAFRVQTDTMEVTASGVGSMELDVTSIDTNPFQPRRVFNEEEIASLAESIKSHQQLQPILVRKVGARYQLISGERRLRATIHAGLPKIRAEIREADDRLVAELAIIENLQRKDLNAIEKAMSFKRYIMEHRCTQEELAGRLKIDRTTVTNMMRLLELPERILDMVQADKISASHARAILALSSESMQLDFATRCQTEGWSVREVERRVGEQVALEDAEESGTIGVATRSKKRTTTDHVSALEQGLKQQLGTKVEIRQAARGSGKIIVHFANPDEFERLREILDPTQRVVSRTA
jgi:ParB family chromosome partitioning protein